MAGARGTGRCSSAASVPALIFGVAVGNVLQGVPFQFDMDLHSTYEGSFFGLLNPYALLCGLLSVTMLVAHGATWLVLKTDGIVAQRARTYGSVAVILTIVLFALGGLGLYLFVQGYKITSVINPVGPSNPLSKTAVMEAGAWFANYKAYPVLWLAPALGFGGALLSLILLQAKKDGFSFLASALGIFGIISTVGVSMFPFILPSSIDPKSSLTVWDTSSSHMTLFIMLVVTAIFLPLILAYTSWVYKVMWGKVDAAMVSDKNGHAY